MGIPSYDVTQWPLVVIVAPADGASDAEMEQHLANIAALYERGAPFAMVVDVSAAPPPPASQRRVLADALASHERARPGQLLGLAMVVSSTIQRGIITAISWAFPAPYPLSVFVDRDEAVTWARAEMKAPVR